MRGLGTIAREKPNKVGREGGLPSPGLGSDASGTSRHCRVTARSGPGRSPGTAQLGPLPRVPQGCRKVWARLRSFLKLGVLMLAYVAVERI